MATIAVHHVAVNGSPHRDDYDSDRLSSTPAGLLIRNGTTRAWRTDDDGTLIPWTHVARLEGPVVILTRLGGERA